MQLSPSKPVSEPVNMMLGLVGAAVGGAVGYLLHYLIWKNSSLYAPVLPGGLLGLGCSLLSRHRSYALAVICGVGAFLLGAAAEWQRAPFFADDSYSYFVRNIYKMDNKIALLLILLGVAIALWFGLGWEKPSKKGGQ